MRGKQIIALLLALFMLAGFLPVAPDAVMASAAGELDFTITLPDARNADKGISPISDASIAAGDKWELNTGMSVSTYTTAITGSISSNSNTARFDGANWVDVRPNGASVANWFTIDIDVAATGTYDFSVEAFHISNNGGANVAVFVNKDFVGYVETSVGDGYTTTALNKVFLNAGRNQITFAKIGGGVQFLPRNLIFANGVAAAAGSYGYINTIINTDEYLTVGSEYDITAGVFMGNNIYKYMNGAAWTGVANPVAFETKALGSTPARDWNIASLASSNTDVATVTLVGADDKGEIAYKLNALKTGYTDLVFTVKNKLPANSSPDDRSFTKRVYVLAAEADNADQFVIDFNNEYIKAADKYQEYNSNNFASVNSAYPVYADAGWAINTAMTNDTFEPETNGVAFTSRIENMARLQTGSIDIRMAASTANDPANDFTIDVEVPEAGDYQIVFDTYNHSGATEVAVFANKNFVGTVNATSAETNLSVENALDVVTLNAGKNTITMRNVGTTNKQFLLNKIIFKKATAVTAPTFDKVELSADKIAVAPNGVVKLTAAAVMSDASFNASADYAYDASFVDADTIAIDAGDILTATGDYDAFGQDTITLTAGATEGYTRVTVTYTVNGATKSASVPVYVIDNSAAPAIFGNSYGFIREVEVAGTTSYKLVLLAAIDSLDYKAVGFNVGGELSLGTAKTNNVYKTIEAAGVTYDATEFGLSSDGYIFYAEYDIAAADADKTISFSAFAVDQDDDTIITDGATIAIAVVK